MDSNSLSIGVTFLPDSQLCCDITCTDLSKDGCLLAAGSQQGYVVLWKFRDRAPTSYRRTVSCSRFNKEYGPTDDVFLEPYFLFVASNNPIAYPVVQVAFASGFRPMHSLKRDAKQTMSAYCGVESAEDVLVSLYKDNSIAVWSLADCRCLHKVKGPPFAIQRMCVFPDDRFIALVGRSKINVIDLWRLKLIGTLELDGTCHFDKSIYSTRPNASLRVCVSAESTMDCAETSTFNVTPQSSHAHARYKKPRCILRVHCGPAPLDSPSGANDLSFEHRRKLGPLHERYTNDRIRSPLLLTAVLDNNDIVVWDLTAPILSYKSKYGASNGPVMVVTRWDRHKENVIGCFERSHRGVDGSHHILTHRPFAPPVAGGVNADFPMLREWIPELEDAAHDICIIDRYIFVMLGIHIFVWYYDYDGALDRVAELPSIGVDGTLSDEPWQGFQCLRLHTDTILLIAWVNIGRVSIFLVPDGNGTNKRFQRLSVQQFPSFNGNIHLDESIHIYMCKSISPDDLFDLAKGDNKSLKFCMIRHTTDRRLSIGMPGREYWSYIDSGSMISACFSSKDAGVLNSCLFNSGDFMYRVDILDSGLLRYVDLSNGDTCAFSSYFSIEGCLRRMFHVNRNRPIVLLGDKVLEWVSKSLSEVSSPSTSRLSSSVMHCVNSSYLVVSVDSTDLLIYSLSSFHLLLALCHVHVAPVRAIYSVYSISRSGSSVIDATMYEIDDVFASIDSDGFLVLVQLPLLLDELCDHMALPVIDERTIYSDLDMDSLSPRSGRCTPTGGFVHTPERRGIHRMQRCTAFLGYEIDRVAFNLEKDLLYVLTCHGILLWRVSTGVFLRSLPYLETYRKAVVSKDSSSGVDRKYKSLTTFADTISSLLTTDWNTSASSNDEDCRYRRYLDYCTPHDLLSLCMFQDKCFKRRLSTSLHISFFRLHFSYSPDSDPDVNLDVSGGGSNGLLLYHSSSLRQLGLQRCWKYVVIFSRLPGSSSMGVRIRPRVIRLCGRPRYPLYHKVGLRKPPTISHSVPVLIFPLQDIVSNLRGSGGTLLSRMSYSGTFCYLGVPSGTFSIPLHGFIGTSRHFIPNDGSCSYYLSDDYLRKEMLWPGIRRSFTFPCLFDDRKILHQPDLSSCFLENRYFSTCMLLRDVVSTFHSHSSGSSFWLRYIDVWLLMHVLVLCTCKKGYGLLHNQLIVAFRYMSAHTLHLHVCRAFAILRCFNRVSKSSTAKFTTICVCHCQGTTFSFGKRCGLCSRRCYNIDVGNVPPPEQPYSWEEDASLMLLVVVAMDNGLSCLCDFVYICGELRPFVAYVTQLMFRHMFMVDEHPRTALGIGSEHRTFDIREYCIEMFALGFASVWTLDLLDSCGILVSSFCKSRVHSIARSLYKSDGGQGPSVQFALSVLSMYRASKSNHWLTVLRKCFLLDTCMMIRLMRWIVRERRLDKWYIETSVNLLIEFVTEIGEQAVQHLPDVVVIIVRCLDPSDSSVRLLMLKPATSALFHLVKNFPMVAFYQETQRFAVGSASGHVVIYDLRTATKCRTFGGELKNVASVAFSATGEYISAYYRDPPCLVIWNCSPSGLLGSLLHSSNKDRMIIKLKPVECSPTTTAMVCFLMNIIIIIIIVIYL
ncbi:WD repeat-containing protein 7 [Babesia sp. Xinjiang]|uniref:WD repeat-containing protein 7 n=1 Tax=Babesia sp. Xinjiang TaxID=462227 RepID=UPI000A215BD9|nr:WD repeat-containing protein 7 [Babesia sp. Xinjiang]ORM41440.1 WD repeat-containing protein 7 [Babesia sp. Xinjiang]